MGQGLADVKVKQELGAMRQRQVHGVLWAPVQGWAWAAPEPGSALDVRGCPGWARWSQPCCLLVLVAAPGREQGAAGMLQMGPAGWPQAGGQGGAGGEGRTIPYRRGGWRCVQAPWALAPRKAVSSCINLTSCGPWRSRAWVWPGSKALSDPSQAPSRNELLVRRQGVT